MLPGLDPLAQIALDKGCFLRREAIALGLSDKWLGRALHSGAVVRIRQGCYVPAEIWRGASPEVRLIIRTQAAMRTSEGLVAASHTGSCALQEIDLWGVDYGRAHVTRLDGGAGRVDPSATHHEGLCLDNDLVVVRGQPATRPARAVLETASLHGVEAGLVAADSALRKELTDPEELRRYQQLMTRWPNAQALRLVTALADGRSGSAGESRSRYMIWAHGLPKPELQHEVYDGDELIGTVDFYWEKYGVLGEFDGAQKYGRTLEDGEENPGRVVFGEKIREDRLRDVTGCRVVRWVWSDVNLPRITCARILRALEAGAAERRRRGA
jgi:hypothetical protein